ncbi:MAG: hypothetical protein AABX11_02160 [Nanoarchaeota archaeon]
MKTKLVRVEQKEANTKEIDNIVNKEIEKLEGQKYKIKGIRLAVGRDADVSSKLKNRFSTTILLMYE